MPHLLPDVSSGLICWRQTPSFLSACCPCCYSPAGMCRQTVCRGSSCLPLHLFARHETGEPNFSLICLYSTPSLMISYWNCLFHLNWHVSVKCEFWQILAQFTPLLCKLGHKRTEREGIEYFHGLEHCFTLIINKRLLHFKAVSLLKKKNKHEKG